MKNPQIQELSLRVFFNLKIPEATAPGIFISPITKAAAPGRSFFHISSLFLPGVNLLLGILARLHFRLRPRHHLAHHDVPGFLIIVGAGA